MSTTVITQPGLQVHGTMTLMAPPANQFPQGVLATVVPTMPTPTLPPTGPEPPTLKLGQWIMDPSKEYVLILTNTNGLVLYQVVGAGDPTSGQFQGNVVWNQPSNPTESFCFCAQADGNAVVYDSSYPNELNPAWHANNGGSNAQYLFVKEDGSFAVVEYTSTAGYPQS